MVCNAKVLGLVSMPANQLVVCESNLPVQLGEGPGERLSCSAYYGDRQASLSSALQALQGHMAVCVSLMHILQHLTPKTVALYSKTSCMQQKNWNLECLREQDTS